MRLLAALASFGLLMASSAACAAPSDEVEKAAFADCTLVLQQKAHVDNQAEMSALGYHLAAADEEGIWASRAIGDSELRIGVGAGKPGCRVRFSGGQAGAIYESVLNAALKRGFTFVDGARKPPEAQFIMDTLASEKGSIGIVSMFRMNSPEASMFAMTLFPPVR